MYMRRRCGSCEGKAGDYNPPVGVGEDGEGEG